MDALADFWQTLRDHFDIDVWTAIGVLGQLCFTMRFAWQWLTSEKQKRSVIPIAFWYFSLAGGSILLVYAIARGDLVITLGQSFGLVVYVRNLILIHRERRRLDEAAAAAVPVRAPAAGQSLEPVGQARETTRP